MKFSVNDHCIGCGLCVNTCPEVFTITEGGQAAAIEEAVSEEIKEQATEAMEACPVAAIEEA